MKKVAIIGHFAFGHEYLDGQTVKTKILAKELDLQFGDAEVIKIDTHGGAKTLLKAPFQVLSALKHAQNVIILPAHNGVRVFGRLVPFFRKFFKGRKIHYAVIGGWLPKFLESKRGLAKKLKTMDGIYVETNTMKRALDAQGFENVYVMPNCKELAPLSLEELIYQKEAPYRLCTFSRVMKEKGMEDAIEAVRAVNEGLGKTVYTLDIYGPVDGAQTEWFENLQKDFPEYVRYGGLVPFDKSVEVLKDYFALLFPTRFYTEGIPGTIIDAYAAGIPVISAKWQSFADIVEEDVTGVGYEFGKAEELTAKLFDIEQNVDRFHAMKADCLEHSKRFLPREAVKILMDKFC